MGASLPVSTVKKCESHSAIHLFSVPSWTFTWDMKTWTKWIEMCVRVGIAQHTVDEDIDSDTVKKYKQACCDIVWRRQWLHLWCFTSCNAFCVPSVSVCTPSQMASWGFWGMSWLYSSTPPLLLSENSHIFKIHLEEELMQIRSLCSCYYRFGTVGQ